MKTITTVLFLIFLTLISSLSAATYYDDANGAGDYTTIQAAIKDVNNGDYYLLPVSLSKNAGDPNFVPAPDETDLDSLPRVIGGRVDMGCYESDAIKVPLNLSPKTVNVKSFGCFISAFITLPKDIKLADIDKNERLLFLPGNIESKHQFIWQSGFGKSRRINVIAVFDKSACMQYLKIGQNDVTVIGQLKSGQFYYGTDKLNVIPWKPFFWWW